MSPCCSFWRLFRSCTGRQPQGTGRQPQGTGVIPTFNDPRFFPLSTLELATQGFSNVIHDNGISTTYSGILEDGRRIAVNVLSDSLTYSDAQKFTNFELMLVLSRIRHPNIVRFIGFCFEESKCISLFEDAGYWNLEKLLFDRESRRRYSLSWARRAAICIGIARGLAYLHEKIFPRIIHRDIKTRSILLDITNYTPIISGFDIALLFNDVVMKDHTLAGTRGFMDPEIIIQGTVQRKSDVYSYGVTMLEIISGRKNNVTFNNDIGHGLLSLAWRLLSSNQLLSIVDDELKLLDDFNQEDARNFIYIALHCTKRNSKYRPSMAQVLLMFSNPGLVPVPDNPGGKTLIDTDEEDWGLEQLMTGSEDSDLDTNPEPNDEAGEIQKIVESKDIVTRFSGEITSRHGSWKGKMTAELEGVSSKSVQGLPAAEDEDKVTAMLETNLLSFEIEDDQGIGSSMEEQASSGFDGTRHSKLIETDSTARFTSWVSTSAGVKVEEHAQMPQTEQQLASAGFGQRTRSEAAETYTASMISASTKGEHVPKLQRPILFDCGIRSKISTVTAAGTSDEAPVAPMEIASCSSADNPTSSDKADNRTSLIIQPVAPMIESTMQKILGALKNVHVGRIGLYGEAGSGKTSTLKALINHPDTKGLLFDMVIWVTVSRFSHTRKIQQDIAQKLSLPMRDCDTEDRVATQIRDTLNGRKFLLLLDNVHQSIKLHEIGIPVPGHENNGMVILATRNLDVCAEMTDQWFEVDRLTRQEAWEVFRCQTGEVIDSLEIQTYARAVLEECHGLPLIIEVTGSALRMESNIIEWKLALKEFLLLATSNMQLKLGYYRLKDPEQKSCFLYCATCTGVEPVDVSDLVERFMDEGLISGSTGSAFQKGHDIVRHLIDACLLESTEDGAKVEMPNAIKEMALAVLSSDNSSLGLLVSPHVVSLQPAISDQEAVHSSDRTATSQIRSPDLHQYICKPGAGLKDPPSGEEWERARMIFLMDNKLSSLPQQLNCPGLLALFLQRNSCLREMPASFFNHMPSLRVVNLSKTKIKNFPESLYKVGLRALILRDCERFFVLPKDIGALKFLEVLDLQGTQIINLPDTVKELTLLKLLRVSFYGTTNRSEYLQLPQRLISEGVISSLPLKEFNVSVYPGDGRWSSNVLDIMMDVSGLNLCSLSFHFPEVKQLKDFLHESPSWKCGGLSKFNLIVGHNVNRIVSQVSPVVEQMYSQYDRCLRLVNGENVPEAESVLEVLNQCTSFYLDHHIGVHHLSEFGISRLDALKFCILRDCPQMEEIINVTKQKRSIFPVLEYLIINYLWKLNRIWLGDASMGSLSHLRYLSINMCPALSVVLTCSMMENLSSLEELVIEDCSSLKHVTEDCSVASNPSASSKHRTNPLRRLASLQLYYLPELTNIWNGPWPSRLKHISLYGCPRLRNLGVDSSALASIEQIKAEAAWWNALEWDDTETGILLKERVFSPIPAGYCSVSIGQDSM